VSASGSSVHGIRSDVAAVSQYCSGEWLEHSACDPQQRGPAIAIRAEQGNHRRGLYAQADIVQYLCLSIPSSHRVEAEGGWGALDLDLGVVIER
jgi:hypothetical protein